VRATRDLPERRCRRCHRSNLHVRARWSTTGHAGIVNSIRQIQKATGIDKVHAVVGGWHLAPSPDEIVAKTVEAFKQIDPDDLIPVHCTGFNTVMAIQREMPAKLIMPSTGTRVVFGA
jgi:7,8-dihydropterin-6-yl-methyl-4-(beta-D-ribofuranosyl)aminobenzene 5'-phosphate synthase